MIGNSYSMCFHGYDYYFSRQSHITKGINYIS